MPCFSIITCTYNAGRTVAECIASVESQGCSDYEHLFIDGFSSDETMATVRAYQARSPGKVRFYQREASGVSRAMNEGVALSEGSIIVHLHGDDCLAGPDVLQTVKALFDRHHATVVVGNCLLTGNSVLKHTWPENRFLRFFYRTMMPVLMFHLNPIPHPSTYLSRSVFERHGGFAEGIKVVMDYDFWFRILKTERFVTTDKVLSIYRFHSETISTRQKELGLREIDEIHARYRTKYPVLFLLYAAVVKPSLFAKKMMKSISKAAER
jgi:glycosyltransferase involved in cell wall biosynthesis